MHGQMHREFYSRASSFLTGIKEALDRSSAVRVFAVFAIAGVVILVSCGRTGHRDPSVVSSQRVKPLGAPLDLTAPLGLPPVPLQRDNPMTVRTVALGRSLFYDRRLSRDNTVSCASCHNPLLNFTDRQSHSIGVAGKTGTRNAPTLINAAYNSAQFWDGRAPTLEAQIGGPMENPLEMNQPHELAVSKLKADPEVRRRFEEAFGPGPVTLGKIEQAIASFERTLISGDSAFDRYEYGGDKTALSPAAIRGLAAFTNPAKGNCVSCHTVTGKYALFTDGLFHNLGVGVNDEGELIDLGRFNETKQDVDKGAFKTPTLRDVAGSPPYMHDGSLKTLKDVVDFYAGRGNSNPYLDKRISAIQLSGRDRLDLVEFLKSLSGKLPPNAGPPPTGE
jgi:cytochrome c peroxidase